MPCRDFYDDPIMGRDYYPATPVKSEEQKKDELIENLKKQVSFAESALCGVMKTLAKIYCEEAQIPFDNNRTEHYEWIDFKDAGIKKRDFVEWYRKHKELDEKHRAIAAQRSREARAKAEAEEKTQAARKKALAKLTLEDKQALGLIK